ncbi:hypothetical protein ACKKBF_B34340 [Auxenochlorella protothecoides x Auxenochlorella symbiontica]
MSKNKGLWGSKGWKRVNVADALLDTDEDGFVELEQLDGAYMGKIFQAPSGPDVLIPPEAPALGTSKKRKASLATTTTALPVEDMRAQLRRLRQEQRALSAQLKQATRGVGGAGSEAGAEAGSPEGPSGNDDATALAAAKPVALPSSSDKKKKAKKTKKKATSAEAVAPSSQTTTPTPPVDTRAWEGLGLHEEILGVLSTCGFSAPTAVQVACLPSALRDRRDIIGAAQTGSGKTLAFGLPIMQALLNERHMQTPAAAEEGLSEGPSEEGHGDEAPAPAATGGKRRGALRALILAPTRELALQVCSHLEVFGRALGVRVAPIVGGISSQKQERLLAHAPEVVVATPGRLWDQMQSGAAHLTDFSRLAFLVIDEADRMVQQGHYSELGEILGRVDGGSGEDGGPAPGAPRSMQTMIFSATLTLPANLRHRLKKGGGGSSGSATLDSLMDRVPFRGRKPAVVDLTTGMRVAARVSEAHLSCPEAERDEYLYCLLSCHPGRTIVFVNAVSAVRRLAAILKLLALPVQALHAGMQQRQRLKALDRFRADAAGVLVATDVAARGLDVRDVRCVVHYQLPASLDTYVHRSGRTGRASAEGLSLALVTPKEQARFLALYRGLGREVPPEFPIDLSLLPAVRKRVRLAVRLDAHERKHSKSCAEAAWRSQHAEELGIELSDEELSEDEAAATGRRGGRRGQALEAGDRGVDGVIAAQRLRAELGALLAEPLQPAFSQRYFTAGQASAVAAHAGQPSAHSVTTSSVALAQSLADSRAVVCAGPPRAKRKKKVGVDPRQAALAAAVAKAAAGRKRSRMLVVPASGAGAFGRSTTGPDALQALRASRQ